MKLNKLLTAMSISSVLILAGCGGDGNSPKVDPNNKGDADMVVSIMVPGEPPSGYVNAVKGSSSSITNGNGLDSEPSRGLYSYNGFIYTTGSLGSNSIYKYSVAEDNSLNLVKELSTATDGLSIPTSFTFVNNSKAYIPLVGTGKLLDINLDDFSIREEIDLSDYAMDADLKLHLDGGTDTNPEPSSAIIRDGKLYLALSQVTSFQGAGAYQCRGKASLLIIDIATNAIEKHIDDDRTCTSGSISPNSELTLTENGDIYVNNVASFGYHPTIPPGYLRIKSGETTFDSSYFFNLKDLDLTADFPNLSAETAVPSYVYKEKYHGGKLYMTMFIMGLTTGEMNDFIGNKNYQPYTLDLVNKTATKLANPPTNGWSAGVYLYNNEIVFPEATADHNGLYKANATEPFLTTVGQPIHVVDLD